MFEHSLSTIFSTIFQSLAFFVILQCGVFCLMCRGGEDAMQDVEGDMV